MCTSPKKAFCVGLTKNGKPDYVIAPYQCHHVEKIGDKFERVYSSAMSPRADLVVSTFIEIPCGRCLDCRLSYSRSWADRLVRESKTSVSSLFVTFTYDDDHLPYHDYVNSESGELVSKPCLVKKHCQDFFKRLRKYFDGYNIRYFIAGEYGETSARPHYHAVIYNLPLDKLDLQFYKTNFNGDLYYTSPVLESIWTHGYVVLSDFSWQTGAYTARYILKKQFGKASDQFKLTGFPQEFVLMSRKPGLGRQYFNENIDDLIAYDGDICRPGQKSKPGRYFDSLIEDADPEKYKDLKNNRQTVRDLFIAGKLAQTDKSYLDLLSVEDHYYTQRALHLKRKDL
ncbi:replication initiator protein [Capybara microvirus Cap1_SP_141]|nr:replication initiator protein [Capybara microvirus Cap1_SP_141]